jgi:hypothetical protein
LSTLNQLEFDRLVEIDKSCEPSIYVAYFRSGMFFRYQIQCPDDGMHTVNNRGAGWRATGSDIVHMHGIMVAGQAGEFQLIGNGKDSGTAPFFRHGPNSFLYLLSGSRYG